jgi:regulator of sirC expression with transglutaminase-like and TPR domain
MAEDRSADEQERSRLAAEARERFVALARRPEDQIDLAEAALLIAAEEYPGLDVAAYVKQIERLAAHVRRRIALMQGDPTPAHADEIAINALHHVLFEEENFTGDPIEEQYHPLYHPRNSFLNEVLDRKRGMPITLSLLYCEVARRAGLNAVGIALPSHFVAEFRGEHLSVLVDPYNRGTRIPPEDRAKLPSDLLVAASKKQILARMLNNLKNAYRRRGPLVKALSAVERILLLNPSLEQVRDRGLILAEMNLSGPAWFDLKLYARLAEGSADADAADKLAERLWREMGRMN